MLGRTTSASDIAGLVARLLEQPGLERALRRRAQALVDGRGATRVAGRLLTLIHCQQKDTSDAAA
jgi:hypothetical protein